MLPGPPPVPVDVRERVGSQAVAEVALLREVVRRDCRSHLGGGSPIELTVDLSFDAAGREAGRSIIGSGPLPAALRTCVLLANAGSLRVDPPGAPMGARVQMELP